eukprot:gene50449-16794_t
MAARRGVGPLCPVPVLFPALILLLSAAPPSAAHTSAVCSSTSESHPDQFIFYVCTGVGANDPVPGQITLTLADGAPASFPFGSWCTMQDTAGEATDPNANTPNTGFLSCFHQISALPDFQAMAVTSGTGLSGPGNTEETIHCNGMWNQEVQRINTCYAAVVEGDIKAGQLLSSMAGTNHNLNPSPKVGGRTPCA